jgi:AAA domain
MDFLLPSANASSIEVTQTDLEATMRQVPLWEREHRDAMQALNRETTGFAIAHLMEELRGGYTDLPEVGQYLDAVERDIKENVDDFLAPAAPEGGTPIPGPIVRDIEDTRFRRYQVNVIIDNSGQRGTQSSTRTTRPIRRWSVGSSTWRVSARWSPISIC